MIVIDPAKGFHVDPHKQKNRLKPYQIQAMEKASDKQIERMGVLAHTVTYVGNAGKGAPGDPAWREEIDRLLKKIYTDAADKYIETGVGLSAGNLAARVRVMLVAYGSGSRAEGGGSPIHEGPAGRRVWNDSLTGRHQSKAKRDRDLPAEFNHYGNNFPERAAEEIEKTLNRVMSDALKNMPEDVLMGIITQY